MVIDDKTEVIDRLSNIILLLKNTAVKGSLNVSDDCLFTRSHSQFISENIENSKQKSIKQPIKEETVLATQKQLDYLNKLKIKYPVNLTKKEAIQLLQEATSLK